MSEQSAGQSVAPSGDQFPISAGDYAGVITQSGGSLRQLSHAGRPLIDGFGAEEMAFGGRGQLLMPWPNRIRDGKYTFDGVDRQLPLSEPARANASHGLARWVSWSLVEHTAHSVALGYRLMAQTGYPWTLDLQVRYELSAEGLRVTQSATNMATSPAPYASGAHPYLSIGPGPVDTWELHVPAATHSVTDERKIPVATEPVAGTDFDFTTPRAIGALSLDHAFTDLDRDPDGLVRLTVIDPATGRGAQLWATDAVRWLQVYTADDAPATARRSLAVEPMTANANAFASGIDLLTLAPAGTDGDRVAVTWGLRALDRSVDQGA